MGAIKKDGKWTRPKKGKVPKKFHSTAESALITQRRKIGVPFALKAQEFDISSWFNIDQVNKTWELTPEKEQEYEIVKDDKGVITEIKAKPTTYKSSYNWKEGRKTERTYSTYTPKRIYYLPNGLLVSEKDWRIYTPYERGDEDQQEERSEPYLSSQKDWWTEGEKNAQKLKFAQTWTPYTTRDWQEYDGDRDYKEYQAIRPVLQRTFNKEGTQKERKEWDDYTSELWNYGDERGEEEDYYLRRHEKFDDYGRPTSKTTWDDYKRKKTTYDDGWKSWWDTYKKSDETYSYATDPEDENKTIQTRSGQYYDAPEARYQAYKATKAEVDRQRKEAKKDKEFKKKFEEAKTKEEKSKILKEYNKEVEIQVPFTPIVLKGNNIENLETKYREYFENETKAERNKRYVNMINSGLDTEKVKENIYNENPELKFKELSQTKTGRKQLVQDGFVTAIQDPIKQQTRLLTSDEKDEYIEKGQIDIGQPEAQLNKIHSQLTAPAPIVKPKIQGTIQPYVDERKWYQKTADWVNLKLGRAVSQNPMEARGLFGRDDYGSIINTQPAIDYGKEVYDYSKGAWEHTGMQPLDIKGQPTEGKKIHTVLDPIVPVAAGVYKVASDASHVVGETFRNLINYKNWNWHKYEDEKQLEKIQDTLELRNAQMEAMQDGRIPFNESLINQTKKDVQAYYDLRHKLAKTKAEQIQIANERNEIINETATPQGTKWYQHIQPVAGTYAMMGTKEYWKKYIPRRLTTAAGFFSEPINWHPYTAVAGAVGHTVEGKGKPLLQLAQQGVSDPAGLAGDFYTISKAYQAPTKMADIYKRGEYWLSKEYPFRADKLLAAEKTAQIYNREYWNNLIKGSEKTPRGISIPKDPIKADLLNYGKQTGGTLGGSRAIEAQGIKLSRYAKEGIDMSDIDLLYSSTAEANAHAVQWVKRANKRFGKNRFTFKEAVQGEVANAQITDTKTGNHYDIVAEKVPTVTIDGMKVLDIRKQVYKKGEALRNPEREYRSFDPKVREVKKDFTDFVDIVRGRVKPNVDPKWFLKKSAQDYTTYNPKVGDFVIDLSKAPRAVVETVKKQIPNAKTITATQFVKMSEPYVKAVEQTYYASAARKRYYAPTRAKDYSYPYTDKKYSPYKTTESYTPEPYPEKYPTPYIKTPIFKYPYPVETPYVPTTTTYGEPPYTPPSTPYTTGYPPYVPPDYPIEPPYYPPNKPPKTPKRYRKKDRKEKTRKKTKKHEYYTRINRLQDPMFRITGRARYSDLLNKMLRERYGNIYA